MEKSIPVLINTAREYGFLRIVPLTDIDSLIAASILARNLGEHDIHTVINLDVKTCLETDEPTILLNIPKPSQAKKWCQELVWDKQDSSLSSYIVTGLENYWIVSDYDKILAILAGIYKERDLGKEGFQGTEKKFLQELIDNDKAEIEFGFRFWGWRKRSLVEMIARTLIPFLPGLTGERGQVLAFLKKLFNTESVESLNSSSIFLEEEPERAKKFAAALYEALEIDENTRKTILLKLIGFTYYFYIGDTRLESFETLGSLIIYESLERGTVNILSNLSLDPNILYSIISLYDYYIDMLANEISHGIRLWLSGRSIDTDRIERPDIYVDILRSLGLLNQKPVSIISNGRSITVLRELLRIGEDIEYALSVCDELQLCKI